MSDKSFKTKLLQGGIALAARQAISTVFSVLNVLVVAKILGPEKYGIVAIAMGVYFFLVWTSKLGVGIYAVRQTELPKDAPRQILAFYNTLGALLAVLLWFCAPAFGQWLGQPAVIPVVRFLALPLWLEMIGNASVVMMERELLFAEIGMGETIGQMCNYAVSFPLVFLGYGYWGPVIGLATQGIGELLFARHYKPVPFQLRWRKSFIVPALKSGIAYTSANWILSLRSLAVPILVTRFAGVEAVGIITLATRFAEKLGVFRMVLNRMSISVLTKLLGQPEKIRSAISQGMVYQLLMVAPACAVFSCCSVWFITFMGKDEWLLSSKMFPFLAASVMIAAMFEMQSSALYAAGKNREVGQFNLGYVALLWVTAILGLNFLGVWGYGFALLAAIPSYAVLHLNLRKLCGTPEYANAFLLVLATLPALFAGPWMPFWMGLLLLAACYAGAFALSPGLRKIPLELYGAWKGRRQSLAK